MPHMAPPQRLQFITNSFGDELLYEVNRNTFSKVGASALYQNKFGKQLFQEDTLYLLVGTDSGLLPKWLMQHELPAGSRYVFIELPQLLRAIREKIPELGDHERVALATPETWGDLAREFRFQDYAYLNRIRVTHSFAATDAFVPEYHEMRYGVEQEVEAYNRNIQLSIGNHVFIRRHIENVADNLVPAIRLKDAFAGQTAVLLGGGPSLDDILPWVIDNRHRLVVIAVSRIARQLLAAGVEPDMVASVDPHPVSFDVSKEMLNFSERCVLVNAFHITPLLLSQWRGPAVYRGRHYPWETDANENNLPNAGPTVSNTALAMAVELGCSQIILGGVDLCFSREGYTHASGSNERKAGRSLGSVGVRVETNDGAMADTDHAFLQAVSSMAEQAQAAQAKGIQLINPAPAAAKIGGIQHVPLAEISLSDAPLDTAAMIAERLPPRDRDVRRKSLHAVKQELAAANGRIRAVIHLVHDALECNRRLFGRDGKQADFRHKKRMDKIERKLDLRHRKLTNLIKDFGAGLFLRLARPDREREWTDEELERFGIGYYQAYEASAKALLKLVETAQQRTDSRLQELDDAPDLVALFKQWQADQSHGRYRIVQDAGNVTPSDDQDHILSLAAQTFEDILGQQDTAQARRIKQVMGLSLAPVRSKLLVLLDRKDTVELSRLAEQLHDHEDEDARDLHALAQGYLAEIQGDATAALGHYQSLLDRAADKFAQGMDKAQSDRLEDALRRMSHITLHQNNPESALMVLDVLSAISPMYEPQYAELLRMTGNVEQAVTVYTDYVQKVPGDFVNMLKLGKLYQDIGQFDSASWIYRHVLEHDGDNTTAKQLLNGLEEKATE